MNRPWIVTGLVVVALSVGAVAAQHRAVAEDRAQRGRETFMAQGCHGCHTVGKIGTPIAPDLSHVGAKYSEAYLKSWLRDPQQQRPAAHMPMLELTERQIAELAAFLASLD